MKKIKKALCTGGILLASTILMSGCNNDDNTNNTHDIKIINNQYGSIYSSLTSASKDKKIKIKAIANDGYKVKGVYIDGNVCQLDEDNNCTFTMEDKDVVVTGEFDLIDYPVVVDFNESEVNVTVNKEIINHDEELVITVMAKDGCLVDKVIVEGETLLAVDNKYTYKIKDVNFDKHISVKVTCIRQYRPNVVAISPINTTFDKTNYFKGELANLTVKNTDKPIRGFISLNYPELVFIKDSDNRYHFTIPNGDESIIDIIPVYTTGYVTHIKDSEDYLASFDKNIYQENEYGIITFTNKNNKYVSKVTSSNYSNIEIKQIEDNKFMFKTPSDVSDLNAIEFEVECLNYINITSSHNNITLLNLNNHYRAGELVTFKINNTSNEAIKKVFIRDYNDIVVNKISADEYSFIIPNNINNDLVVDYVFRNPNEEQYDLVIDGADVSLTNPVIFTPGKDVEFSLNLPTDQYVKGFKTDLDVKFVKENTYKVSIPAYINSDVHITPVLSKYFTFTKTQESKEFTTDKEIYKDSETGYIYVNSDNAIINSKNYPNLKFNKIGAGLYSFVIPNNYNNEIDITVINGDNDKNVDIIVRNENSYGYIKYDHRRYAPYEYVDVEIVANPGYGFVINLDDKYVIDKGNNIYSIKASNINYYVYVDFIKTHNINLNFQGVSDANYDIKSVDSSVFVKTSKNTYIPEYNELSLSALNHTKITNITINDEIYLKNDFISNMSLGLSKYNVDLIFNITVTKSIDNRIITPKGEYYMGFIQGEEINLDSLFRNYKKTIGENEVIDGYYINGEKYDQPTLIINRNTTIELKSKFHSHIVFSDGIVDLDLSTNEIVYLPNYIIDKTKEIDYYQINGNKYYSDAYQVPAILDDGISISVFYKDLDITIIPDDHGEINIEKVEGLNTYKVNINSDIGYHYVENSISIFNNTTRTNQYIQKNGDTFVRPEVGSVVIKGIFIKDENIEPLVGGSYILDENNPAIGLNNDYCSILDNGISLCSKNVAKFNTKNKTITSITTLANKDKFEIYKDVNYSIVNNRIMMPDIVSSDIEIYMVNENKIVVYDSTRGNYFTYKYVEDHALLKEDTYNVEVVRDGKLYFYGLTIKGDMITLPIALNPDIDSLEDLKFNYTIYGNTISLDNSIIGEIVDTDYGFIIKNSINRKDLNTFYDNGDIEFIEDYRVIVDSRIQHGSISVDNPLAKPGELVKVNIIPDEGYYYENNSIAINYNDHRSTIDINNPYFLMPKDSDVVLYGIFRKFDKVQLKVGTYSLEFNSALHYTTYGKYTNNDIKANKANPSYITIKPNNLIDLNAYLQHSYSDTVSPIVINNLKFNIYDNIAFANAIVDENKYEYIAYLIDEDHFAVKNQDSYMIFKYQEDKKFKENQNYQLFIDKEKTSDIRFENNKINLNTNGIQLSLDYQIYGDVIIINNNGDIIMNKLENCIFDENGNIIEFTSEGYYQMLNASGLHIKQEVHVTLNK